MKKILVVVGSGMKNGNTYHLAKSFVYGAKESGNEVELILLGNKNIHGCINCQACQKDHHCHLQDDMLELYDKFLNCDVLVFASPLYFWSISSMVKAFIDRLYAISTNDEYPYKETVLLMTSGSKRDYAFDQPVSFYNFLNKQLKWKSLGTVLARGCKGKVGEKYLPEESYNEAYRLGNRMG